MCGGFLKGGIAMEVHGTLNVQRLYETLALIISKRENVNISVRVTEKPTAAEKEYKTA
jgi:hypothetical protein